MDNNMKKLQWIPYGTPEHAELVRKIQKDIKSTDFILCTKGHFDPDRSPDLEKNAYANRYKIGGPKVFEADVNVFKSDKFYFVRRDKAEYNLQHRQVNVGILITDKLNRVLVLQKQNGYLSMVGGHTDFTRDVYNMTIGELCRHNIMKEMSEELTYKKGKQLIVPNLPKYYVTEGHDMWDLFHAWFIYHLEVEDLDKFKFGSGEPNKHKVVITDIDTILNGDEFPKIKNSLRQVSAMLNEERTASRVIVNRSVHTSDSMKMDVPPTPLISVPRPPAPILGSVK